MSGGEVTPVASHSGRTRRFILVLSGCALLGFIAWIIYEYRIRAQEMARLRFLSQLSGALIAYTTEHDQAKELPALLATRFGNDVMARYAWITTRTDLASSAIMLIERPDQVDGDWCLAVFGDGHVKKVRRDEAIGIIRDAQATITAPAPSP